MPTMAGNKQLSLLSSFTDRVSSIFPRKKNESDQLEKDIKVLIPAPTQWIIT